LQNQPTSNRLVATSCRFSALVLIIAAFYRALSINNLVIGVRTGDISKQFGASVLIDGGFASLLMLLTAIWLLFLVPDLKKGIGRARVQTIIIGIAFSLFGGGFLYRYPSSLRLIAFLLIGLIILIPPIFSWKKNLV